MNSQKQISALLVAVFCMGSLVADAPAQPKSTSWFSWRPSMPSKPAWLSTENAKWVFNGIGNGFVSGGQWAWGNKLKTAGIIAGVAGTGYICYLIYNKFVASKAKETAKKPAESPKGKTNCAGALSGCDNAVESEGEHCSTCQAAIVKAKEAEAAKINQSVVTKPAEVQTSIQTSK